MNKLLMTYGAEALRSTFWSLCKQDHPDTTMLRFLRARKWDVEAATAMLASTLKWRLDTGVDHMSQNGDLNNDKEIPKYIDQQASGKVYAMGCNIVDQPVCYVHFKKHLIWGQPSASMKKFIICQMESWRLLFVPPNDKMVILFDCTGFGPSNLDMPNLLYVLQCLQSYFPECLSVLYLHNAPWILKQAWQLVKGLLDPVVRSKVVFSSTSEDLMENIPEDRLLEFVGGQVDQKSIWNDPKEGENDAQLDTVNVKARTSHHKQLSEEFERTTRLWLESNGKEYIEERRTLAKQLRLSQFDLEPFWRGLTVHHRNGDLVAGNSGIIKWEYRLKNGENIRQIIGHRQCRKTLTRELDEIAVGAPVDFVEKRTEEMLADRSWGHWSTCEDMGPKPTAFVNGQLIYDTRASEVAPPPASQEDAARVNPQPIPAIALRSADSQIKNILHPRDTNAPRQTYERRPQQTSNGYLVKTEAPMSRATMNGMATRNGGPRATATPRSEKTTNYGKAPKPKKRKSFLGSLRSMVSA